MRSCAKRANCRLLIFTHFQRSKVVKRWKTLKHSIKVYSAVIKIKVLNKRKRKTKESCVVSGGRRGGAGRDGRHFIVLISRAPRRSHGYTFLLQIRPIGICWFHSCYTMEKQTFKCMLFRLIQTTGVNETEKVLIWIIVSLYFESVTNVVLLFDFYFFSNKVYICY